MSAYGDEARIRALLVSSGGGCELFSVVRWCRYPGVSVGPEAHVHSFPTQRDKYSFRVCKIRLAGAGLAESIVAYNARAVTVLGYVLQFIVRLRDHTCLKTVPFKSCMRARGVALAVP
eukprot:9482938-Pyramimonas_sp.AAC.1